MRIVAVVGVLDEVDLIEGCVDHLGRIGVERILLNDRGSTDGTLELASSLARVVPIDVHHAGVDDSVDLSTWSRPQLDWARSVNADWVLFLDADELWLSASGSVEQQLAAAKAHAVLVRRYNVVVTVEGPRLPQLITPDSLEDLDVYVEPTTVPDDPEAADSHLRWIRGTPMPKVAARPQSVMELDAGHHGARLADGLEEAPDTATGLLIAHLPFTTFERFERKVRNIRETIRRYPDFFVGKRAWHWRRWATLSDSGLRREFDAQVVSQHELESLRTRGSIRSAAELLRSWADS